MWLKCVDIFVKNEVILKMWGMYGCFENNGIKVIKEYIFFVIVCMWVYFVIDDIWI